MNLKDWVNKESASKGQPRKAILEALAAKAGVAAQTIEPVTRGARMGLYSKARAVSEATGWAVSILELCDEDPAAMAPRIAAVFPQAPGPQP